MLALSKDRELHAQWQRAAELLLAEADIGELAIKSSDFMEKERVKVWCAGSCE
jgi:hypothetical protein